MMNAKPDMTDVFQFMEVRAPFSPALRSLHQNYVRDDYVGLRDDRPGRIETDLQTATSPSAIGRLVYEHVFCSDDTGDPAARLDDLIEAALDLVAPYQPLCPPTGTPPSPNGVRALSINELERRAYINDGDLYYLLPERMEQIEGLMLFPELPRAFEAMEGARRNFDLPKLIKQLETIFSAQPLRKVVFEQGLYAQKFRAAKRTLFDTLYLLYVLRRRTSVNLEHVIDGLRVLHVLEALSIDSLIKSIKPNASLPQPDASLRKTLEALYPELLNWNVTDPLPTLPLIQTDADFEACLRATPVIHPIFARLHRYKLPFNDLKPIGIGDLKVVKQWLIAYLPGEISHIENVLKGEVTDRTHRRLEKTDESFSFSSSSKEWSQKDMQATERMELKREVENIVKSDLSLGANANLTYNSPGGTIISNVGANFGYKRDATDQAKASETFGRETVARAIEQVEKNVAETRSITRLFETEETNKHGFDNKDGKEHVTGIYRWLDKKYKAQLFNFGKRMMFEFMIPEPAAFFAEARLQAFKATMDCPQPPAAPPTKTVSLNFGPADINEAKFQELRLKYDLKEFTFPSRTRRVAFNNPATSEDFFQEKDIDGDGIWYARTHLCKLNAKGYALTKLLVGGYIDFHSRNEDDPKQQNTLEIQLDGHQVVREQNEAAQWWQKNPATEHVPASPIVFANEEAALTLGFWDVEGYYLSLYGELELGEQALLDWQTSVFNKVTDIEQQRLDKENQEAQLAHNSRMSEYRSRLSELKASSVNDLLQGQSEAFNREIIRTELKKHCLTLLTKEFDADSSDDLLSTVDATQERPGIFNYRRFKVTENLTATPPETTCSFEDETGEVDYPAIALEEARYKGRFIQFLEQAFEWHQLAYAFYPYFWATQPDWISMMSRQDDADPNMTSFLQAGSAKVVLAVTPAYEEAVLHFLATREPWEGGPAPVIGDPLFIPLHEELRKQQDDLYNAIPEGEPWTFTLPTSLIYLEGGGATLPTFPDVLTP